MSHTISVSLVVRRDMNSCPPRQLLITFLLRPLQRREDSYKRACIRRTSIRPCTEEDSSVMVRICWTPTSPSQADIMIRKQLLRKEFKKIYQGEKFEEKMMTSLFSERESSLALVNPLPHSAHTGSSLFSAVHLCTV